MKILHRLYYWSNQTEQNSWLGALMRFPLKFIPSKTVLRIRAGVNKGLFWRYGSGKMGFVLGAYEPDKQRLVQKLVAPGWVIWDVGANIGFYSIAFARMCKASGHVYAFEPSAKNLCDLQFHVDSNALPNVTVVQCALSNGRQIIGFDPGPNPLMGSLTRAATKCLIPTVSGDDFISEYPRSVPKLIKIDVEGVEGDVLLGIATLLVQHHPILLLAVHGTEAEKKCGELLREYGYELYFLDGSPVSESPWKSDELLCIHPACQDFSEIRLAHTR